MVCLLKWRFSIAMLNYQMVNPNEFMAGHIPRFEKETKTIKRSTSPWISRSKKKLCLVKSHCSCWKFGSTSIMFPRSTCQEPTNDPKEVPNVPFLYFSQSSGSGVIKPWCYVAMEYSGDIMNIWTTSNLCLCMYTYIFIYWFIYLSIYLFIYLLLWLWINYV